MATRVAKRSGYTYIDPKDINQDGVVSGSEQITYSLRHPELNFAKRSLPTEKSQSHLFQYTQDGALNSHEKPTSRLFDQYA